MKYRILACAFAAGCSGGAETDTSGPVETDTTPACQALTDGDWTGSGPALGMAMGVTLTMDTSGCTFTLTDWSMQMGSLPDSGTVDDDTVTLGSDSYWATCTGTATGGTAFDGVCADDNAAFSFELN